MVVGGWFGSISHSAQVLFLAPHSGISPGMEVGVRREGRGTLCGARDLTWHSRLYAL